MREMLRFYMDGRWVEPVEPAPFDVINPATEQVCGRISLGSAADVDNAVAAAGRTFRTYSQTTREQRLDLLNAVLDGYMKRYDDLAEAVMEEMGAPWKIASGPQAGSGRSHLKAAIRALESFSFEEANGQTQIIKEPIGVCGMITPWNWPLNQVVCKVAPTVKRVTQELGGKSANIILDDADFQTAVTGGTREMFLNTGQSCDAPSRMLVPGERMDEAAAIAVAVAESIRVGDPADEGVQMGPLVSETQWNKVQSLIRSGIDEGATLVAGGPGRPDDLQTGYYARPTVFAGVSNEMTIAREEIFGPVLSIIPFKDEDDAVRIANDTDYGLAAYVSSGNGREWGAYGLEEYLELKSVHGYHGK